MSKSDNIVTGEREKSEDDARGAKRYLETEKVREVCDC